ncbi:hypothetical protein SAY87_010471 [Trapa incisa]|uniref:Dof zinc finger protein n=1 Tax=Trapa incisa TaxID=236973 RepID=A0AAN7JHM9_9MYRT|nr:hypothetical protein SAY87_010471 [Trapa incisa]
MKDIQSIAGGSIFDGGGGGGSGGDGVGNRNLRTLDYHHHHRHQELKCPRCDSLNTKFCYYNNYNLSQPRHFCKNCHRYWTNGGVLRNVPVGGGCRKKKRSKAKLYSPEEHLPLGAETVATTARGHTRDCKTSTHSSNESSSLIGTTTRTAVVETVSATSSVTPASFFSVTDSKSMNTQAMDAPPNNHGGFFSEMESLAGLMAPTSEPPPFGYGSVLDQSSQWSQQEDLQQQKIKQPGEIPPSDDGGTSLCQTVRPPVNESCRPWEWPTSADQEQFDLMGGAVDQGYWGQISQWADYLHLPDL